MEHDVLLLYIKDSLVPAGALDRIRELAPQLRLVVTTDEDEVRALAGDITVAAGQPPREWLASFPRLKWFQQFYAGADWLSQNPAAVAAPWVMTNARGVHPIQITEHVFAGVLAFARQLPKALEQQRARTWDSAAMADVFELHDKTLLVIGVGAIGERIARVGAAFGMNPIGIRRSHAAAEPPFTRMYQQDGLHVALPEADVVVSAAPLTPETENMIDEAEMAMMKPGAVIVNIGRGGTINEPALLAALNEGRIRGAMLDVFEQEPLPGDAPHWHTKNLIITPHTAGDTPRYYERTFDIFFDNLERFTAGVELRNVVDKQLGY